MEQESFTAFTIDFTDKLNRFIRNTSEVSTKCSLDIPTAEYRPGPTMMTPDTMSRYSSPHNTEQRHNLEKEVQFYFDSVTSSWSVFDKKIRQNREKARLYKTRMARVQRICQNYSVNYAPVQI